ncbi:MAG: SDR family NAD(P)-dependent oxidoreductase [Nitriliruptorales bacterium]|nr:SDR family NAD(P)-dependent oxidoreductase [Nitriliruptorales bacterium]
MARRSVTERIVRRAWFAAGKLRSNPLQGVRDLPGFRPPSLAERVAGKVVMVTGASSGIGEATARHVGRAGATVLLVARRPEALAEVREAIEAEGGTAVDLPTDLTDADAVAALGARVVEDFGGVDVLINNAGMSIRRSIVRSVDRPDTYERTMELNYLAAVRLMLALLPSMRERGGAHIVNVTTLAVQVNAPRFSAYVASKSALEAFTRVARAETLSNNIVFTNIRMPLVRTPMSEASPVWNVFPALTPEDAAEMVVDAIRRQPRELNTPFGSMVELGTRLTPRVADQLLHRFHRLFPEEGLENFEPSRLQRQIAKAVGPRR